MKNILTLDRNEPEPLYYQDKDKYATRHLSSNKEKLKKRRDKAKRNELLEARKTMINPDFWEKFMLVARVCYLHDEDADIYDVFETYRTKLMGGWESSPEQLSKLDSLIAQEELKYGFARA